MFGNCAPWNDGNISFFTANKGDFGNFREERMPGRSGDVGHGSSYVNATFVASISVRNDQVAYQNDSE
jgi:hypothetical protein